MAFETLDEAVHYAKEAAGLDPVAKYPAYEFMEFIPTEWTKRFWTQQVERAASAIMERADGN